jgi:hypothetical protein
MFGPSGFDEDDSTPAPIAGPTKRGGEGFIPPPDDHERMHVIGADDDGPYSFAAGTDDADDAWVAADADEAGIAAVASSLSDDDAEVPDELPGDDAESATDASADAPETPAASGADRDTEPAEDAGEVDGEPSAPDADTAADAIAPTPTGRPQFEQVEGWKTGQIPAIGDSTFFDHASEMEPIPDDNARTGAFAAIGAAFGAGAGAAAASTAAGVDTAAAGTADAATGAAADAAAPTPADATAPAADAAGIAPVPTGAPPAPEGEAAPEEDKEADKRSPIERFFILWLIIALVVGAIPGIGLFWWQRTRAKTAVNSLVAENTALRSQIASMQVEFAGLKSEAASSTAALNQANKTIELLRQTPAPGIAPTSSIPASNAITFQNRLIDPNTVDAGKPVKVTVTVIGGADEVWMQVVPAQGTNSSKTYKLTQQSGGTVYQATWERTFDAPTKKGQYIITMWGLKNGSQYTMDGTGSLTVK